MSSRSLKLPTTMQKGPQQMRRDAGSCTCRGQEGTSSLRHQYLLQMSNNVKAKLMASKNLLEYPKLQDVEKFIIYDHIQFIYVVITC
jgi:hypothetical protein